jgi:hypothetical protein
MEDEVHFRSTITPHTVIQVRNLVSSQVLPIKYVTGLGKDKQVGFKLRLPEQCD